MKNKEFTFSSDGKLISLEDLEVTSKIAEDYFGTEKDPNQMETSKENRLWVCENQKYVNIVYNNSKIIGFAFMLPCTKYLMDLFISIKINERELFERIKKIKFDKELEVLYLCSTVIKKEFRKKGLATEASLKLINKLTNNLDKRPILFYENYSKEGETIANKLANKTGLKLLSRKTKVQ